MLGARWDGAVGTGLPGREKQGPRPPLTLSHCGAGGPPQAPAWPSTPGIHVRLCVGPAFTGVGGTKPWEQ